MRLGVFNLLIIIIVYLMTQTVKCLPTPRDTWVHTLSQDDPLEKEMATHSRVAW